MTISLNNLSKSAQRSPSNRQDLSMICQWSSSDLHSRHSLFKVLTQFKTISMIAKGSDHSTNTQRMLNECSRSTQGVLSDLIDLPMMSQWSFNQCQFLPPQKRDGCRSTSAQGSPTEMAFSLLLRDRANVWSLNGRPTISVPCKGPLSTLWWYFTNDWLFDSCFTTYRQHRPYS